MGSSPLHTSRKHCFPPPAIVPIFVFSSHSTPATPHHPPPPFRFVWEVTGLCSTGVALAKDITTEDTITLAVTWLNKDGTTGHAVTCPPFAACECTATLALSAPVARAPVRRGAVD